MTRLAHAGRLTVALTGLVIAAGGAVTTILAPGLDPTRTSAGAAGPVVAWSLVAAAATLIAAGVVAWLARPGSGLAILAFWAAAAWLAPELAGSSTVSREARSLGVLLAPFVVPLLIHVSLRAVRADTGRVRVALITLYLVVGAAAIGHALTWDPFLSPACLPVCTRDDNVIGWFVDLRVSLGFRAAGWLLALVAGSSLAVWASVRLRRHEGHGAADHAVGIPALATGLAIGGWAFVGLAIDPPGPMDVWSVRSVVVLSFAVTALGAGIAWSRFREGRRAAGVRSLVELLDAGAGTRSLSETLAVVLRDPTVCVAYPLDRGFVDDQGMFTIAPATGGERAMTPIERGGAAIALVGHAADLDPDLLSREIGAAARLAVDNERLAAVLRAQVRELQASRERIVAAGDAARGRLERDLHDGAQQRLLAVSYELRLAQAAAGDESSERRAEIDVAVDEIDHTLVELRELAHGIWPAVLAEAGLEAALGSLADDAPIPVVLEAVPEQRFPVRTEAAAYLAVMEALRRATAGGAQGLAVHARQVDDRLLVEARVPGVEAPGPWLRVDDRVGAAGGRSAVTYDPATGTLLTVELPCA